MSKSKKLGVPYLASKSEIEVTTCRLPAEEQATEAELPLLLIEHQQVQGLE
jgi:hypothetical protein